MTRMLSLFAIVLCTSAIAQERWEPAPAPKFSTADHDGYLWAQGVRAAEGQRPRDPFVPMFNAGALQAQLLAQQAAAQNGQLALQIKRLEAKIKDQEEQIDMHKKFIRKLKAAAKPNTFDKPAGEKEWTEGWKKRLDVMIKERTAQSAQDVLDWAFAIWEPEERPKFAVIMLGDD